MGEAAGKYRVVQQDAGEIAEIVLRAGGDCETVFAFRLRQTLAEDHHIVQPFDQDKWAARYAALYDSTKRSPPSRFYAAGTCCSSSPPCPLMATSPLPIPNVASTTFATIVETMGGHDLNHITELQEQASQLNE